MNPIVITVQGALGRGKPLGNCGGETFKRPSVVSRNGVSMNCPTCTDTVLAMSNRENIEIDYCPSCRGVWLDRGELDKIIDSYQRNYQREEQGRSTQFEDRGRNDQREYSRDSWRSDDDDDDRKKYESSRHEVRGGLFSRSPPNKPKKKEKFLSDLFDFG